MSANAVINLGGTKVYTLNQLVENIEQTLKVKIQVRYESARKFDVPHLQLDIHTASEILRWRPEIPLSEGIARTARWIKAKVD